MFISGIKWIWPQSCLGLSLANAFETCWGLSGGACLRCHLRLSGFVADHVWAMFWICLVPETQGPSMNCLRPYVSLIKAGPRVCLGHTWFTSVILVGPYLNTIWGCLWDTLKPCQIVFASMSEYVALGQGVSCMFEPCQDMLKHVEAMSDVQADIRVLGKIRCLRSM